MGNKNSRYTKKELKEIAAGIPTYPQCNMKGEPVEVKRQISYEMVMANPQLLALAEKNNLPLKPGQNYVIDTDPIMVNHLKRMGNWLKNYGEEGIKRYIDFVRVEYGRHQEWVQQNSVLESTPVQALDQEEIDRMNQEEHERPHPTSISDEEESIVI